MNQVRSAEDMSTEHFELHMNRRHANSLGGLEYISLGNCSEYIILCWQNFHRSLHRLRPDIDHQHDEPEQLITSG